jgi:hypothetical protein
MPRVCNASDGGQRQPVHRRAGTLFNHNVFGWVALAAAALNLFRPSASCCTMPISQALPLAFSF